MKKRNQHEHQSLLKDYDDETQQPLSLKDLKNVEKPKNEAKMEFSTGLVFAKLLSSIISFGVVLFCLFLNTAYIVFVTNSEPQNVAEFRSNVSALIIPPILPLFFSLVGWIVFEKHDEKNKPKGLGWFIINSILVSIGQGAGESLFLLVILPKYGQLKTVGSVFTWSILPSLFLFRYSFETCSKPGKGIVDGIKASLAPLGFFCGLAGVVMFFFDDKTPMLEFLIAIPLCSAFFLANFFHGAFFDDTFWRNYEAVKWRHRYIFGFLTNFVKMATIAVASMIIGQQYYGFDPKDMLEVWKWQHLDHNWVTAVVGLIATGYLCHLLIYCACVGGYQWAGCILPALFAPVVACVWQLWLKCETPKDWLLVSDCTLPSLSDTSTQKDLVQVLLLCIPYWIIVLTSYNPEEKLSNDREVWYAPEMNSIAAPVWVALNRARRQTFRFGDEEDVGPVKLWMKKSKIFVAVTMWHEGYEEIKNSVDALVDLAKDSFIKEQAGADYVGYDFHFFVDDGINADGSTNQWVETLRHVILDQAGQLSRTKDTWYGKQETWLLGEKGQNFEIHVHCKNCKKLVKQKKRWSQIVYLNLFFKMAQEQIVAYNSKSSSFKDVLSLHNFYVLLLDCDTRFKPWAVTLLLDTLRRDNTRTGAVCGRIFPEGEKFANPLVWFQQFEYAVGHYFQKAAEDVFGTVLCCPGCFALINMFALQYPVKESQEGSQALALPKTVFNPETDSDIASIMYCKTCEDGLDVLMYDQGEDRLLCTFLIKNGWKLSYVSSSHAYTHCPETFAGFFSQRRRWIISTLANIFYLLSIQKEVCKNNRAVSLPFMLYIGALLIASLLSPITVIIVFIGGFLYAYNLNMGWSITLALAPALFYWVVCAWYHIKPTDPPAKKSEKVATQINVAKYLTGLLIVMMLISFIGIIATVIKHPLRVDSMYLLVLCALYLVAGVIHAEFDVLLCGIMYLVLLPTMYMILIMYAVNNLQDQSWGTRDASSDSSGGGQTSSSASGQQDQEDVSERFYISRTKYPDLDTCVKDANNSDSKMNQKTPTIIEPTEEDRQKQWILSKRYGKRILFITPSDSNGSFCQAPYSTPNPSGYFKIMKPTTECQIAILCAEESEISKKVYEFYAERTTKELARKYEKELLEEEKKIAEDLASIHSTNEAERKTYYLKHMASKQQEIKDQAIQRAQKEAQQQVQHVVVQELPSDNKAIEEKIASCNNMLVVLSQYCLNKNNPDNNASDQLHKKFRFVLNCALYYERPVIAVKDNIGDDELAVHTVLTNHAIAKNSFKWDNQRPDICLARVDRQLQDLQKKMQAKPHVANVEFKLGSYSVKIPKFWTKPSVPEPVMGRYTNLFLEDETFGTSTLFVTRDKDNYYFLQPFFHEYFRQSVIKPSYATPTYEKEIKESLMSVRTSSSFIMTLLSISWLVIVLILSSHRELETHGLNSLGIAFVIVFGVLTVFQFFAMLLTRSGTLLRKFSLIKIQCGQCMNSRFWSFPEKPVIENYDTPRYPLPSVREEY